VRGAIGYHPLFPDRHLRRSGMRNTVQEAFDEANSSDDAFISKRMINKTSRIEARYKSNTGRVDKETETNTMTVKRV